MWCRRAAQPAGVWRTTTVIVVTWVTFGIGALWPLIDGIMMLAGEPKDSEGYPLRP